MNQNVDGFRLSPQQRRLWRLQQGDDAGGFRAQVAARLEGALDVDRLRAAIASVVAEHEILRTRFACLPGTSMAVQFVEDEVAVDLVALDVAAGATDQSAAIAALIDGELGRALSVGRVPLLAAGSSSGSRLRFLLVACLWALLQSTWSVRIGIGAGSAGG